MKDISQFNEDLTKNHDEESGKGYFHKVDVQYTKELHKLHNGLPFLLERLKIEKNKELVANLHDKNKYVIHKKKFQTSIKIMNYF